MFRPSLSAPTMTLEEFGDQQKAEAEERARRESSQESNVVKRLMIRIFLFYFMLFEDEIDSPHMSHVMVLTLDDVLLSHVSYHRYSQLLADGEEDDADLLDKVSLSVYVYVSVCVCASCP